MRQLNEGLFSSGFNLFLAYKFVKKMVTPFEETEAFKLGIIDEKGKILKKSSQLTTSEERGAYTLMDRLVWNLKKIVGLIPGGKTKIGSFTAAVGLLMKEDRNPSITSPGELNNTLFQLTEDLDEMERAVIEEALALFEKNEEDLETISNMWDSSRGNIAKFKKRMKIAGYTDSKLNKLGLKKFYHSIIGEEIDLEESPTMNAGSGMVQTTGLVGAYRLGKNKKKKEDKMEQFSENFHIINESPEQYPAAYVEELLMQMNYGRISEERVEYILGNVVEWVAEEGMGEDLLAITEMVQDQNDIMKSSIQLPDVTLNENIKIVLNPQVLAAMDEGVSTKNLGVDVNALDDILMETFTGSRRIISENRDDFKNSIRNFALRR